MRHSGLVVVLRVRGDVPAVDVAGHSCRGKCPVGFACHSARLLFGWRSVGGATSTLLLIRPQAGCGYVCRS